MAITCSGCGADSGLTGQVSGYWTCQPCLDRKSEERRLEAIHRTRAAREDFAAGRRNCILVPGTVHPGPLSDADAEQFALEHHGIEWERHADGSIWTWAEM